MVLISVPPLRLIAAPGLLSIALLAAACGSSQTSVGTTSSTRPPEVGRATSTTTTLAADPSPTTSQAQPPREQTTVTQPPTPIATPDGLAILGVDGVLRTSSDGTLIEVGAGGDVFAVQPTWAPGGSVLAWGEVDSSGVGQIVIAAPDATSVERYDVPFVPFYLHWSPDSTKLAFLGGNPVTLGIADRTDETVDIAAAGTPYYFDWAPDSARLVTHVGEVGIAIGAPDERGPRIAPATRSFLAPDWTPDGSAVLYVVEPESGIVASADGLPIAQVEDPLLELVSYDVESEEPSTLIEFRGRISFEVSPDGASLAFSVTGADRTPNFGSLVTMDLESRIQTTVQNGVIAFEWAPDSTRLAFLTTTEDGTAVQWGIGNQDEVLVFGPIVPSATYTISYLPFFDQFARSMTRWAPDSSGIVYSAVGQTGDEIWWQPADGSKPGFIAAGSIGTFATR